MSPVLKCSVYAGLIAGTVDIAAASLINTINPLLVLLAIASGLLGKAAFHGGGGVMVLGLVLQWVMSIIIAGIFTLAAARIPTLARRWVLFGALYGVMVFIVMNFVVVPLSVAPLKPGWAFSAMSTVTNLAAMLVFGWIVAYTANRFLAAAGVRTTGAAAIS
jgi:uncharacterized membrane protein YagU involved in acid resistance